jgi:glycine betaine transporter
LFGKELDPVVFYIAVAMTAPFIFMGLFMTDKLAQVSAGMVKTICDMFQSTYLFGVTGFLIFCVVLALSPWGKIKLGKDADKPEYSTLSWFAMLFSAGMGIGLLFWAIAEPMSHMANPPMKGLSPMDNAVLAQEIYFFHWGFHAWGVYAIVGLALAYSQFRKNRGALVSGCLVPIFGEKHCKGTFGKVIDAFCVWATLFGVVTGIGTGAMQMTGGLSYLLGFEHSQLAIVIVVGFVTVSFVISAITGIGKGIKSLSLLNIILMMVILAYFTIFGPTAFLFKNFAATLGSYLKDLPMLSSSSILFGNDAWTRGWTVFYWAFWIAWAPFTGGFIARISKGRTIREFVFVVIVAPVLFSFIFSTVMGGTGIFMDMFEGTAIGKVALELSLFETLRHMPMASLISGIGVVLATSFVITSADSATYVMARFCTQGVDPKDPKATSRLTVIWGVCLGVLTIAFIFSGGLNGLKSSTIIGSLPFIFVMFLSAFALVKDLAHEKAEVTLKAPAPAAQPVPQEVKVKTDF